jgi:hypothetical protein
MAGFSWKKVVLHPTNLDHKITMTIGSFRVTVRTRDTIMSTIQKRDGKISNALLAAETLTEQTQ